jgi:hypothetical protein
MTLEIIRRKARDLHARTRRELLGNIAILLLAIGLSGFGIAWAPDPVQRAAFALVIAWSLLGQYALNRGMWSPILPGDAALTTGLEYYRRELERRAYLLRRVLRWSFGPIVLGVVAFYVPTVWREIRKRGMRPEMFPFLVLFVIWLVAWFVIRMREQRKLQRELDELIAIEKENSS